VIDLSSRLPEIFDIDTCLPDLLIDDTRRSLLANWRWMMNLTRLAFRLDEHGWLLAGRIHPGQLGVGEENEPAECNYLRT